MNLTYSKASSANLIQLTQENRFMKGKGEGRLTKRVIHLLQNYYGIAIRHARESNVAQMKMTIGAVLCHCVRNVDENGVENKADRRKYCPKTADTWCKYQKSFIEGT